MRQLLHQQLNVTPAGTSHSVCCVSVCVCALQIYGPQLAPFDTAELAEHPACILCDSTLSSTGDSLSRTLKLPLHGYWLAPSLFRRVCKSTPCNSSSQHYPAQLPAQFAVLVHICKVHIQLCLRPHSSDVQHPCGRVESTNRSLNT